MRAGSRRALVAVAVALLAAVGLVGFAHTQLGRSLLAWLPGMRGAAGCPVLATVDPAHIERFRIAQLEKRRGVRAAASVPALDFELGRTTRAQVDAWAQARGAACKRERADTVMRCLELPAVKGSHNAPIDDLFLLFDATGRLVAVDAQRHGLTGALAIAYLTARALSLGHAVGPPTRSAGSRDPAYLDAHPFARVELEYGYRDYLAQLSAMNFCEAWSPVKQEFVVSRSRF